MGVKDLLTRDLVATVGDDFVHIYIALRARASLPHLERELAVVLAVQDLIGGLLDQGYLLVRKDTELVVCLGCRFLNLNQGADDRLGHMLSTDRKVLMGPFGLGSLQGTHRYRDLSE